MNKSTRVPPLNPLRMFKGAEILPAKYNNYAFDHGFFWQQIRTFFQGMTNYAYKISYGQDNLVYIDSLAPKLKISLYDDNGELVSVLESSYSPGVVVPANVDSYYGDTYNTFLYNFNVETMAIPAGYYYLWIEELYAAADDPENTFIISEAFQVKTGSFRKTMLIEYSHSSNEFDVLFREITAGYLWQFRTELVVEDPDPASHDTGFEDMGFNLVKCQSVPYRLFKLIVGGNKGVPAWVLDKVNRILSCGFIYIDGVRYEKDTNANWSFTKVESSALRSGTIQLREADNTSGWEWNNSEDIGSDGIFDHTYRYEYA